MPEVRGTMICKRDLPCLHLMRDTGETVQCGPQKKCRKHVYECGLHLTCVMGLPTPGVAHSCGTCPDYVASSPSAWAARVREQNARAPVDRAPISRSDDVKGG